jgi:hypothetical protein
MENDLRLHQRALENLKLGFFREAKEIYSTILGKPYMAASMPPVSDLTYLVINSAVQVKDLHSSSIHLLKYVTFKNYAAILEQEGHLFEALKFHEQVRLKLYF